MPSDNYNPESNSVVTIEPTDDLPQEFKYVEPPGQGVPAGTKTEGNTLLNR